MMAHILPNIRQLAMVWGILSAMTLVSMFIGIGNIESFKGWGQWSSMIPTTIILVVTIYKARQILYYYLNLRCAPKSWQVSMNVFVWIICALVLGAQALIIGLA
jgi:hypothetical protein